jgi:hypothetical protein
MLKWFSHIDITNHCHIGNCTYCSRFERHVPASKRYFMSLETIEAALIAYRGFPNPIGIIGGEPQLHPQFNDICLLLQKHNLRGKYGLWTSINPAKSKYSEMIGRTFGFVAYNEHNQFQLQTCRHQPLTLALQDMVPNKDLQKDLAEQCYFRLKWCGTVNPNGAFHCEIAAALALLMDKRGWDVKSGWWNNDWHEQYEFCLMCGGCIPQDRQLICDKKQKLSPSFLAMLQAVGATIGDYELIEEPYSMQYLKEHSLEKPGAYRGDRAETEQGTINIDWGKYAG